MIFVDTSFFYALFTKDDDKYLKKYRDKEFSAVDCLSFVVMDKLGITEALTFDARNFSHRFIVRPGPQ